MKTVGEICHALDNWANPSWAEDYDNVGLLVGRPETAVTQVLVSLDVTESIVEEAAQQGCQLIIAHHPLIFKGLKKLTGRHWVERTVMLALEKGIAIYAIHTNLDNAVWGVNAQLGKVLGLQQLEILRPFQGRLQKVITYVPEDYVELVRTAMFSAGGGQIGKYDECSVSVDAMGTFRPKEGADPFSGELGKRSEQAEKRLEVLVRDTDIAAVVKAMKAAHPYEEVAYECIPLSNEDQDRGAGMIGSLPQAMGENEFISHCKKQLQLPVLRHTALNGRKIERVAFCGGSGSFLLGDALAKRADAYLTGDLKYHEFFEADGRLLLADIGHFEGEQYTQQLLVEKLRSFATFAVRLAQTPTNPIFYA